MKTYITKPSHLRPKWHVFDATDKTLGRLATEVSSLLIGKGNPRYTNNLLTGDYVIIVNAEKVRITGNNKAQQKKYYKHSSYPGGLTEVTLERMREKQPTRILRTAVRGMLPKTSLGRQMLSRLKVYAGESHPHEAQIKELSRPTLPKHRAKSVSGADNQSTANTSDLTQDSNNVEAASTLAVAEQIEETTAQENTDHIDEQPENSASEEEPAEEENTDNIDEQPENSADEEESAEEENANNVEDQPENPADEEEPAEEENTENAKVGE